MSPMPWQGRTEQIHTVRLVYTSGETQIVRWLRQWDVDRLAQAITDAHSLEAKRSALLASYRSAGVPETHPDVVFLVGADGRKHVYRIMCWDVAIDIFSTPCRQGIRTTGVYPYDLHYIEIVESCTVIAEA